MLTLQTRAAAAGTPSLTVKSQQLRRRAATTALVPLWDTSWWVAIAAQRGEAPLAWLEYTARFVDSTDSRPLSGRWELSPSDTEGLSGRVVVKCLTRPDYDRRVRVQLRVRDAVGNSSEWAVAEFPVRDDEPAGVLLTAPPSTDRVYDIIGTAEVEATDGMTLRETKAKLQRQARDQGGDGAVGLRLVRSTEDRTTFAADVIRYKAAGPAPIASPVAAPSERVIGEIVFRGARH